MGAVLYKIRDKIDLNNVVDAASTVILGKEKEIRLALAGLLSGGHLLIEDLPGLGKTTFVLCLGKLLGLQINRIQFTNDLLPADILGFSVLNPETKQFEFRNGPIFSQIVLGDELNRASPKTQSAFLQAMEEHKVTMDGQTYDLPQPFLVIATQNPLDQVGTHPLPESQLDRFMLRMEMGYPNRESERAMLTNGDPRLELEKLNSVLNPAAVMELREMANDIHVSAPIVQYIQDILTHSRMGGRGLSPRAGLMCMSLVKSWALISGRSMVLPDDVQDVAPYVFAHRLGANGAARVAEIIAKVPVP